jgi:hypothetical protein
MEIKAIYKVRAWVNRRDRENVVDHPYSFEEVVVNNLESAQRMFDRQVMTVKNWEMYGDKVYVELFVPHIFEDGTLAYWPDNNEYIRTYGA